jgi:electron transport complex protein RnfE
MILPPGGFILIGLLIAAFNLYGEYQDKAKAAQARIRAVPAVQRSEG